MDQPLWYCCEEVAWEAEAPCASPGKIGCQTPSSRTHVVPCGYPMFSNMSGCNGGGKGVSPSWNIGGGGGGMDVVVVVGGPSRVVPLVGGLLLDTAIQEISSFLWAVPPCCATVVERERVVVILPLDVLLVGLGILLVGLAVVVCGLGVSLCPFCARGAGCSPFSRMSPRSRMATLV